MERPPNAQTQWYAMKGMQKTMEELINEVKDFRENVEQKMDNLEERTNSKIERGTEQIKKVVEDNNKNFVTRQEIKDGVKKDIKTLSRSIKAINGALSRVNWFVLLAVLGYILQDFLRK